MYFGFNVLHIWSYMLNKSQRTFIKLNFLITYAQYKISKISKNLFWFSNYLFHLIFCICVTHSLISHKLENFERTIDSP